MKSLLVRALIAAAGVVLISGAAPAPSAGKVYTVTLAAMAFGAPPKTVHVGDAIAWVNNDIFEHTATARDGRFDVDLTPKARVVTVLTKPGTVQFYCRFHPGMTGQFVVVK